MLYCMNRDYEETDEDQELLDSDEEVCANLAERLSNCDLNDAQLVWNALNNDEHQEFQSLLNSKEIYNLVPKWNAWWECDQEIRLIEEISEDAATNLEHPPIKNIIDIKISTSHQPAAVVKYNIINVLSAYTLTARYFNGEHHENCLESSIYLLNLSNNLSNNENFNNIQDAITSVHSAHNDVSICKTFNPSMTVKNFYCYFAGKFRI